MIVIGWTADNSLHSIFVASAPENIVVIIPTPQVVKQTTAADLLDSMLGK